MWDALYLNKLKHSDGLQCYATAGCTVSWPTDTKWQVVKPTNTGIGSQILLTYPNYYSVLFTQIKEYESANYEYEYQMKPLGTIVFGYVQESVTKQILVPDSITITPGNFTVTLPQSTQQPYQVIITTPGEYVFTYSKSGYSTATKTVIVKQWKDGDDIKPIQVLAELTLLSGKYVGYVSGTVTMSGGLANAGVTIKAVSGADNVVTTSDDKGNYYMVLPVGDYAITYKKSGFESRTVAVKVLAGKTIVYNMWLEETYSLVLGIAKYSGQCEATEIRFDLFNPRWQSSKTVYVPFSIGDPTGVVASFRFNIASPGKYKVSAIVNSIVPLYGQTRWFDIGVKERKNVVITLATNTGDLTASEIQTLTNPPARQDITYPTVGEMAILTTQQSL